MSDKTELPKEDKQLIGKIDELLGQLKTISQSVFELREHASLVLPDVAPVEQVEQPKSIVKEEVKEMWRVEVMLRAGYRDDVKIVVTLNDGFISETGGRQLATQIKALLATL
jgi:hypothetical protein